MRLQPVLREPALDAPSASPRGLVVLVGAGPGDPDLLTVKGLRFLRRADVVVYDRLVHPTLLDEAPARAELVYAGKKPGAHTIPQSRVCDLLIENARLGRTVVRLKGGDPFVFGRGGEEALACAEAGVTCQVVPGISSAVGVPEWAGIPVTHRNVAASFAVVTAHRAEGAEAPDWHALARIDTLVVLMGVRRLPEVARALIEAGRDPATPAAVVERGTLADGRTLTGTLQTLPVQAAEADVRSPAVVVVGEVVSLRPEITTAFAQPFASRSPRRPS